MSNILKAIINIKNNPVEKLKATYSGRNAINNIGEALELYIQDAFADTIVENDFKISVSQDLFYWYQSKSRAMINILEEIEYQLSDKNDNRY